MDTLTQSMVFIIILASMTTITLLCMIHINRSFDERKKYTPAILLFSMSWLFITWLMVDIVNMVLVVCNSGQLTCRKSFKEYWRDDPLLTKIIPVTMNQYRYIAVWDVDNMVKAERKLSGLCIECGQREINEPTNTDLLYHSTPGHHELCKANDIHFQRNQEARLRQKFSI